VPRGICAVMLIDACPYTLQEKDLQDGYHILPVEPVAASLDHWAKGHLVQRFPIIEPAIIKKIDGLELFSFFSAFQQATNFTLTRGEGQILLEFIEQRPPGLPLTAGLSALKPGLKPRSPASAPAVKKKAPARSTAVALLKCESCGRFIVGTEAERHVLETHAGQPVEWKKMK